MHVIKHWGVYIGRILLFITIILQACAMNYLLIHRGHSSNYGWIAADLLVLATSVITSLVHRWAKKKYIASSSSASNSLFVKVAIHPLGFVTWLVYSCCIVAKVIVICESGITHNMKDFQFYSLTTLKLSVGMASVVFLFECLIQHNPNESFERKSYADMMAYVISVDILDTVEQLDVVTEEHYRDIISVGQYNAILAIFCLNLILASIPLLILGRMRRRESVYTERLKAIYAFIHVALVNCAFFIMRLTLYFTKQIPVSVFLVKNVIILIIDAREFYLGCCGSSSEDDADEREVCFITGKVFFALFQEKQCCIHK